MVLMSGGFVINDVVWELHETTLARPSAFVESGRILCYTPSLPLRKTEMEPWWAPFCCKYTVFPVFIRLEVI